MKFTDLEPRFLRIEKRADQTYFVPVDDIDQAQGIQFLCPICFQKNGGAIGTHAIICWSRSRGVPDDQRPGPGRWALNGPDLAGFTLNGDGSSRSVSLNGGCNAHFFITNGEIQFA